MLICSCNVIDQKQIEETVLAMLEKDCWQLIVPGKVFREMAKRGRCCGCFPNVLETIIEVTERYHREHNQDENASITHLDRVRELRLKYRRIGQHERSRKGHRAA